MVTSLRDAHGVRVAHGDNTKGESVTAMCFASEIFKTFPRKDAPEHVPSPSLRMILDLIKVRAKVVPRASKALARPEHETRKRRPVREPGPIEPPLARISGAAVKDQSIRVRLMRDAKETRQKGPARSERGDGLDRNQLSHARP